MTAEGWTGWDEYAPFYDWENARTLGRRDVPFWRRLACEARGPVLELGCGTGRVSLPLARAGVDLVGIDRSAPMLARAAARLLPTTAQRTRSPNTRAAGRVAGRRSPAAPHAALTRGDIRSLPFRSGAFALALAPYGVLQSLTRDTDLAATLASVARVLTPGAIFGIDLVPDVPQWREYTNRTQLRGRAADGSHLTLVETVRQDPKRRLTRFDQTYTVRRGRRTADHTFTLTFRTLTVQQMARRLDRAGFSVESVLGDYRGRAWDPRADVWIILAKKR